MKDWKGNEIKIGQTIIVVEVINEDAGAIFSLVNDPTGKEYITGTNYCWKPRMEVEVLDYDDLVDLDDSAWKQSPINLLSIAICKQDWEIICIKGVSDSEEEYYKHKFSVY